MGYRGYFTRQELIAEVELLFPFVAKPDDSALLYSEDDDCARYVRDYLWTYTAPSLPRQVVMYVAGELGTLSRPAMAWFLPSLLRTILSGHSDSDRLCESLAADLECDVRDHLALIEARYGWLRGEQIACLQSVLELVSEDSSIMVAGAIANLELLLRRGQAI